MKQGTTVHLDYAPPPPRHSRLVIASLFINGSVVLIELFSGFVFYCLHAFDYSTGLWLYTALPLIGISLGVIALYRVRTSRGALLGTGLALTAVVMGSAWLVILILMCLADKSGAFGY